MLKIVIKEKENKYPKYKYVHRKKSPICIIVLCLILSRLLITELVPLLPFSFSVLSLRNATNTYVKESKVNKKSPGILLYILVFRFSRKLREKEDLLIGFNKK